MTLLVLTAAFPHPQSPLHASCTSWLQALAFPQHGQSPEPSYQLRAELVALRPKIQKEEALGKCGSCWGHPKHCRGGGHF